MIRTALVAVLSAVTLGSAAADAAENDAPRAPAYQFVVSAAGTHDLGSWSKVSGLEVTWDVVEYWSGGHANVSRPYFPANTKYGTVKLSRASSDEVPLVLVWLRDLEATRERPTLTITLLDEAGVAVARWQLHQITVRNYAIGGSESKGSDVAIETLVLAHEGMTVAALTE